MYSTPELITALSARGLLPQADADRFRRLHEDAPGDFGPRVLLKWLVNRGRLTVEQADRLAVGIPGRTAAEAVERLLGSHDDLQLAPLDDDEPDEPAVEERAVNDPPTRAASSMTQPKTASQNVTSQNVTSQNVTAPQPVRRAPEPIDDILQQFSLSSGSLSKSRRKGWDTPLMLAGGGALLLLIFGGVFLWWRLGRQSGDDAFAAAEEAYVKASYVTAVERFDRFLENFAEHPSAGTAVVHRGLAQIRIDVEAGNDWNRALATAQKVLPEISRQTEFGASKIDLRALLPEIVEHLARQSLEMSDPAKLQSAREAKSLFDRYLADDPQATARGAELDDVLKLADRRLERERRIAAAAAAMLTAGEKYDAAGAFAARDALLAEYPDAAAAPPIVAAAAAVAVAAARAVEFVDAPRNAEQADRPGPSLDRTTLVRYALPPPIIRPADAAADAADGEVVVAVTGGTGFALDSSTGRLRWRRDVGFDERFEPIAWGEGAGRTILLDDSRHQELMAVEAATGRLRWRLAAPSAEAWPVIAGSQILVTLRDGRILIVDVQTGKTSGFIRFPEELVGGSVADIRGQVRYQLARGGRMYVVDAQNRTCLEAVYLGHAAGYVRQAPLVVGPYLAIVDGSSGRSRIRLLKANDEGRQVTEVGSYTSPDEITTMPAAVRRLVATVGAQGSIAVFDFSRSDPVEAIKPIVTRPADGAEKLVRYAALRGGDAWFSGSKLESALVEPSVGKLTTVRTWPAAGPAVQTPQWAGGRFVDFRDDGAGGMRVSAYEAAAPQPLWQIDLNPSVASPPQISPDGRRIMLIAGNRLYETPLEGTRVGAAGAVDAGNTGFANSPAVNPLGIDATNRTLEPALELGADWRLPAADVASWPYSSTAQAFAIDEPAGAEKVPHERSYRSLMVISQSDGRPHAHRETLFETASAPTRPFRGGAILAARSGQVHFADPSSGKRIAEPFQPPLVAGSQIRWSDSAVVGEAIFIADRDAALYRLEVEAGPPARLVARKEVELPAPIGSALLASDKLIWYAEPPARVAARRAEDLTVVDQRAVAPGASGGKILWGPVAAGNAVYAAGMSDGKVYLNAWQADGKFLWAAELDASIPGRPLPPVALGDQPYFATTAGDLLKIDAATGNVIDRRTICPGISAPPIVADGKLVFLSSAGELLRLEKP